MGLKENVIGKIRGARTLAQFVRNFRNWSEVWAAYRKSLLLPPLVLRDGLTMYHGKEHDAIMLFREIFVDQSYTAGFYRPHPSHIVLELGGNIGFFALFLESQARGIRVHSFEPAGDTRARLERNVKENGLDQFVTVHPFAVSNVSGVVQLKRASNAGHRSLFSSQFVDDADMEAVRSMTLREAMEICQIDRVDLLKIDIEGAEIEVVEAADAETWRLVRQVVVEYHDLFRPGCRERVTRVLKDHGFSVEDIPEPDHDGKLGLIRAVALRA